MHWVSSQIAIDLLASVTCEIEFATGLSTAMSFPSLIEAVRR